MSTPVRARSGGGVDACVAGVLAAPSVHGHGLPVPQEPGPIRIFFQPLVAGDQEASLSSLSP